jgi:phosphoribosylformimino-5-aminoimidazole carboxamide ribotide isomerase
MILFPAIDIKEGRVVRLRQGDYGQVTVYGDSPLETARGFAAQGADHLHVVDLDGARGGVPENFQAVREIIRETGLFVQIGGGFRTEERIREALEAGAGRVILGTAAAEEPEFLDRMVERYKDAIAVGVDVKDGRVAVRGWEESTGITGPDFCRSLADRGVATVIYTDISRDGEMAGTNMEAYRELSRIPGLRLIASGGITYEEEIRALAPMVYGAILGKALYSGLLDLKRCLALASEVGKGGVL